MNRALFESLPKKTQKIAEKSKKRIFSNKKTPSKIVKRHLVGRFLATPRRMFSFAETSSLWFCIGAQAVPKKRVEDWRSCVFFGQSELVQGGSWAFIRIILWNQGGRGVFFEGVQKYFPEMGKTWLNFSKARDARGARGPRGPW